MAAKTSVAVSKISAIRAGHIGDPIILELLRLSPKLLLAVPVLVLLYFFGLAGVGMLGPDEPRYAAIGREMARTGDWVTPRLWGEPWFEKPALLYWLVALGNLAGFNADLAPRIPVAAVSVGFLVFFFLWMRREFGETSAWYAAVILATSAGWLAYSHVAVTDVPLAATFGASMLLSMPWIRSGGRRGLFAAGLFLGLAMLAKGLVPLVLSVPLVCVGRRRWRDLLLMTGAAVAVAAPWYSFVWVQNGDAFVQTFFWKHHFSRFISDEIHHVQPWWYYFPVVFGLLFPWTPAVITLSGIDWREPRRLLLIAWVAWGFLFFSLSANKLPGYVLPLLPALAALIGIQLARKSVRHVVPICALLVVAVPVAASILPTAVLAGLSRAEGVQIYWLAVAAVLAAAMCIWVLERVRSTSTAFAATGGLMAASIIWLITTVYPELDNGASARPLWSSMNTRGDASCVDALHRGLRYGVYYYAGRELPACSGTRDRNHDILDRDLGESVERQQRPVESPVTR